MISNARLQRLQGWVWLANNLGKEFSDGGVAGCHLSSDEVAELLRGYRLLKEFVKRKRVKKPAPIRRSRVGLK